MFNNKVIISGTVFSDVIFDHTSHDTNFYKFHLKSNRLSNNSDILPIIFNEQTFDKDSINNGKPLKIEGEYRSFNLHDKNARTHLILNIFAAKISEIEQEEIDENSNLIELNGYICKSPSFRTTPLNRKICDVLLAVNRGFNKSDYIPCILWGKNAELCKDLKIGTNVEFTGRIQSRDYQKKSTDETLEKKTAYEVSVAKLKIV